MPARQTQLNRAGPVEHRTHLFKLDVVRAQYPLEPWYWSSVNGVYVFLLWTHVQNRGDIAGI